jgi:hypothetical protein
MQSIFKAIGHLVIISMMSLGTPEGRLLASDRSITCEGVRKDVGTGVGRHLSKVPIGSHEELVTLRIESSAGQYRVRTQLPFFDGAEFLFEESQGSQRGLYFKNLEQQLFVVLLLEQESDVAYFITQPFDSFSDDSWNGAVHITLKCRDVGLFG